MEFEEAKELMRRQSIVLKIDSIVTEQVMEHTYDYTDGHAYVMRVVLGEIAKERRYVPLKSVVPRRSDLLNAVFERSFNKLTPEGRWIFLTVSGWRSAVPELALLVVVGNRGLDVEAGIDECLRLSLIARHELADGEFCYEAPELARLFAKKKLQGDPDRLVIQEDLQILRQFGVLKRRTVGENTTDDLIASFLHRCIAAAPAAEEDERRRLDAVMCRIADLWPKAWPTVAELRKSTGDSEEEVAYALRRAVEEMPYDKSVWLARAEHARGQGDEGTRIASLVSAVDADPSDVELIRDTALQVCQYLDAHKYEIPAARRGVYLASLRAHMQEVAEKLDATGLSRLAWLFLLEENVEGAWRYANMGLSKDSTNIHCLRLVERLDSQGYGRCPR